MTLRSINHFNRSGCVSVWIGDINSEEELDRYLRERFPIDFGFSFSGTGRAESAAFSQPGDIVEILRQASQARHFIEQIARCAPQNGIQEANCVLILYACEYLVSEILNLKAPLRFLGAFRYDAEA